MMQSRSFRLIAVLVGLSLLSSGCVAAAVGAAGGVGGYAWSKGKLSFTTPNTIPECQKAAEAAFSELGISITENRADKLAGRLVGVNAMNKAVVVDLEPQSSEITKLDIRVGFWGEQKQSTLIADSIRRHLR